MPPSVADAGSHAVTARKAGDPLATIRVVDGGMVCGDPGAPGEHSVEFGAGKLRTLVGIEDHRRAPSTTSTNRLGTK